ncbi:MAG: PIG-L deacetylase family protein [Myxococcaceae bacterium]
MLPLRLGQPPSGGYELLCLGAHSDDLEIGCSGTVLRLLKELPVARVTWVVLSGNPERAREARAGARRVLGRRPGVRLVQETFRDGYFPYLGGQVKDFFEKLKREVAPDLVFTHYREDRHQDHRLVSELTYNTFRSHLVLEYEIFKVDGDLGRPNVYVPLSAATVQRKVALLEASFGSQRDRRWFSEEAFRALLRLRGIEAGSPSGYAEAFYGRKVVL